MRRMLTSQMNIKSDGQVCPQVGEGASGKSVPLGEKVRIATLAVIAAAKGRSLALSKADQRALAAMAIIDAAEIVAHPEREAEIRARVERATLDMVMAARASRSGRKAA